MRARREKCREQVFGSWLREGLSVQTLEVQLGFGGGPSGDSHRAWVHLVTCNNALLPYSHAKRPENPQGHKRSTGWT